MSDPVLELRAIRKAYHKGLPNALEVLSGVDFTLQKGELVGLVAPSGAGKSTLLHIAGLLDVADTGEVLLAGDKVSTERDAKRTMARRRDIGFVYQFHHLLPEFSALENIILPQLANGVQRKAAEERALMLVGKVGLSARANHRPAELSGGEQQRIALCRALANQPRVLLADEPTGNLDPETSGDVFRLLVELARETGLSALIATHNTALANQMDRVVLLENGQLVARP